MPYNACTFGAEKYQCKRYQIYLVLCGARRETFSTIEGLGIFSLGVPGNDQLAVKCIIQSALCKMVFSSFK